MREGSSSAIDVGHVHVPGQDPAQAATTPSAGCGSVLIGDRTATESFLSPGVVLMPSYVNIGAPGLGRTRWIEARGRPSARTAQIGADVHLPAEAWGSAAYSSRSTRGRGADR